MHEVACENRVEFYAFLSSCFRATKSARPSVRKSLWNPIVTAKERVRKSDVANERSPRVPAGATCWAVLLLLAV